LEGYQLISELINIAFFASNFHGNQQIVIMTNKLVELNHEEYGFNFAYANAILLLKFTFEEKS